MWWCLAFAKWGKACPAVCRPFLPPTRTMLSVGVFRLTSPFQYFYTYYISGTSFVWHGLWLKLIDAKHFVAYCFLLMRWPSNRPEVVVLALLDDRSETGCFCTEEVQRSQNMACWEVVFWSRGDVQTCAKTRSTHGGGEFWGLFFWEMGWSLKVWVAVTLNHVFQESFFCRPAGSQTGSRSNKDFDG